MERNGFPNGKLPSADAVPAGEGRRPSRSGRIVRAVTLMVTAMLGSCAMDSGRRKEPAAGPPQAPGDPSGLYSAGQIRSAGGAVATVRLFPDGTAYVRWHWPEDGCSRSCLGAYDYEPVDGGLEVRFVGGRELEGFSTGISGNPPTFVVDGIKFVRRSAAAGPDSPVTPALIAGTWETSYDTGVEILAISLGIRADGTFSETIRYPVTGDSVVEPGIFRVRAETGIIIFEYDNGSGSGFTALYDHGRRMLFADDGDFRRSGMLP